MKSTCLLVGSVSNFSRIREERIVNNTISYTRKKMLKDIFRVAFYQPPFPKYYIDTFSRPAFTLFFDNETRLCIARQGDTQYFYKKGVPIQPALRSTQTYYIGKIIDYSAWRGVVNNKVTYIKVIHPSTRDWARAPMRWQKPQVLQYQQIPEQLWQPVAQLLRLVLAETYSLVGKQGVAFSL